MNPHRRWQARGAHAPRLLLHVPGLDVVLPTKGVVHDGEGGRDIAYSLLVVCTFRGHTLGAAEPGGISLLGSGALHSSVI